jgi:HAD superfamily hydrolase (TIGR01459 family)
VVPTPARFAALIDRYEGFLFDAYGVLVDAGGVAPGAAAALAALTAAGKPFAVVTNDASRLPTTAAARFARVGLPIAAEQVVSSGLMLGPAVAAAGLAGARAIVLGTADARAYAADAGLEVVATADDAAIDALVICDDAGFDFLAGMNAALTACVRALDGGRPLGLIVANPDLVFPRGGGRLGFTAGTMAAMIEAVLARRYVTPPRFVAVGKPAPAIFAEGQRRLGVTGPVVMIGDQLETDIAGARAAGLDAALIEGVSVCAAGGGGGRGGARSGSCRGCDQARARSRGGAEVPGLHDHGVGVEGGAEGGPGRGPLGGGQGREIGGEDGDREIPLGGAVIGGDGDRDGDVGATERAGPGDGGVAASVGGAGVKAEEAVVLDHDGSSAGSSAGFSAAGSSTAGSSAGSLAGAAARVAR